MYYRTGSNREDKASPLYRKDQVILRANFELLSTVELRAKSWKELRVAKLKFNSVFENMFSALFADTKRFLKRSRKLLHAQIGPRVEINS